MNRTAFVTGATGFLGLNLVEELVSLGWRVLAFHRPSSVTDSLRQTSVEMVVGDICSSDDLLRAIPEGIDGVFHLAASISFWPPAHDEQTRINVDGTRNVVMAALKRNVGRMIHTSTYGVYGFQSQPLNEDSPHLGKDSQINYERTKARAEEAVRRGIDLGLDAVILNPCNIIGPYDVHGWARAVRMMSHGRLPGIPPGGGTFCHSREVARAHVSAFDHGRTGENYILGGVNSSYLKLAQTVARVLEIRAPLRTTPPWILKSVGYLSLWLSFVTRREPNLTPEAIEAVCRTVECSTDRAERELGYRPAELEDMVRDCVAWLRSEKLIA